MNSTCDICATLSHPKHQILVADHWDIALGNDQAYLGRAYVTLRTHKASLSKLTPTEWQDFQTIVPILENAYQKALGANPLNWACLMNNAFQHNPAQPHVHWHLIPRHKQTVQLADTMFEDTEYGHFYTIDRHHYVNNEVVKQIAQKLKAYL